MIGYTVLAAVVLAVCYVGQQLWQRRSRDLGLPVVKPPAGKDIPWAIMEGYKKYPDSAFVIPTSPPRVILPMSLLDEVNHAREENISFVREVYELLLGRWTGAGVSHPEMIHAVRTDLTKNIGAVLPVLQDESRWAIDNELGSPQEWTAIPLYPKLLRLVSFLSGRVFVGLPLSREEEWVRMTIGYSTDLVAVREASLRWNPMIRPLVAPFLETVRKTMETRRRAGAYMEPFVKDILAGHEREKAAPSKPGSKGAFISWMLKYAPARSKNAKIVGDNQLSISFAAIHTTSMTTTMVLWDLVSRPEYIKPLRDEIEKALREDGMAQDDEGNQHIATTTFAKMKLLDSFIKESMRCSPINFTNTMRCLVTDYTFSNGLTLPKGTRVAFPLWGVYNSKDVETFSPEYNKPAGNPGPEVFDGYRFARLRNVPGREARHQAVTTGPDASNFGHGPHACPGRFFALYEIKALLIELLLHFDMRLQGDEEGKGGQDKRPPNFIHGLSNIPFPAALLEIRKRAT